MKESSIIANSQMVRSLLNGSRNQIRENINFGEGRDSIPERLDVERLWVKETWNRKQYWCPNSHKYFTDYPNARLVNWQPAYYMPRSISRILLNIESVHCERLQDISAENAIAEGLEIDLKGMAIDKREDIEFYGLEETSYLTYWKPDPILYRRSNTINPIEAYQSRWESIYGDDSWSANPLVWVIKFEVENIKIIP